MINERCDGFVLLYVPAVSRKERFRLEDILAKMSNAMCPPALIIHSLMMIHPTDVPVDTSRVTGGGQYVLLIQETAA